MRRQNSFSRRRSPFRSSQKQRLRALSIFCLICCFCACLNSVWHFGGGNANAGAVTTGLGSGEPAVEYDRGPDCRDLDNTCGDIQQAGSCLAKPERLARCARSCGMCVGYSQEAAPEMTVVAQGKRGAVRMPMVGFGTAGMSDRTDQAVAWALDSGYRLLDSAQAQEWYREDLVSAALQRSGVARGNVFLTSKLHPRHHGTVSASRQLNQSLAAFKTEYLDLLLLHYPRCWGDLCGKVRPQGTWQDSWRALEQAVDDGRLRAIGVSNFNVGELEELQRMARVPPAVVQNHIDLFAQNRDVQWWCRHTRTLCQAYSSQGSQWVMRGHSPNPVLHSPVVLNISAHMGRTPSQVVLRWGLQSGHAVIPQSSNREHIASNFNLFDFVLPLDAMQRLDSLDGTLPDKA
mmetsp:Transcript_1888/g.5511  ORF Transcript_1888/g.5511 Transcript_1888/m.5511 type:complete len:403 (-) Transcript_1888:530-1738(-)